MSEPLKITKKIVGYRVVTPEESSDLAIKEETSLKFHESALHVTYPKEVADELCKQIDLETEKQKELKRPRKLTSETYRLKPPHAEHAIYVHISDIIYEDRKYPYEIFFSCKNPVNIMWVSSITLLLSEAFREAIIGTKDLSKIINNLKDVCDATGGYWAIVGEKKKHVGSLIAEVGYILEEHIDKCNAWNYSQSSHERPATKEEKAWSSEFIKSAKFINRDYKLETKVTNPCPDCGSQLTKQAGCDVCLCGYSKCS